jgi:hypothetical protein
VRLLRERHDDERRLLTERHDATVRHITAEALRVQIELRRLGYQIVPCQRGPR